MSETGIEDRVRLRARYRATGGYLLRADIQSFYQSIYTHSIRWALYGKVKAKQNRYGRNLGNNLDYWIRQAQDQQTKGIPIGPDTSLVIAEIVLSAVDEALEKKLGRVVGFRAIDDYELAFKSRDEAEGALAGLQTELMRFELQLNQNKCSVHPLPEPITPLWTTQLRTFKIRSTSREQISDLMEFFSLAFELFQQFSASSILRYAIGRTSNENIDPAAWPVYQDLLLQCATSESGTIRWVLAELDRYASNSGCLDHDRIQQMLTGLITRHLPLGHGSEVAWAIWTAIKLKIRLGHEASVDLTQMEDPLVPILALDADARGLFDSHLDKGPWSAMMTVQDLHGANWLLAYEASVQGWLPSVGTRDHIKDSRGFSYLRRNDVRFYNRAASARYIKTWPSRFTFSQLIGYGI